MASKTISRESQIRAAGMVQAVIASGSPISQWVERSRYGLRLALYMAAKLDGMTPAIPPIPKTLKESK